jgi:hypothetical protein
LQARKDVRSRGRRDDGGVRDLELAEGWNVLRTMCQEPLWFIRSLTRKHANMLGVGHVRLGKWEDRRELIGTKV